LRPEEHQPSGTCNFSRIDNATLQLVLSNATVEGTKTAKVRVYATNYNVKILSALKSYLQRQSELLSLTKIVRHSQNMLVASGIACFWLKSILQNTLLFEKPLRAFYTKCFSERKAWRRLHSGMVIIKRIGQLACLLPNSAMIGNGRASETERVLAVDEGLIIPRQLKIQSIH
jgi:hypothetical protein